MVFSSSFFLFHFLPIFLGVYYLAPNRYRNSVALAGSILFYAWGAPRFVFVLILSSLADYHISAHLQTDLNSVSARDRKMWLSAGLIINIGVLLYFKYANFFIAELTPFLNFLGMTGFHWTHVALPIGISFFTFQKISYLIDVYRGTTTRSNRFSTYLLYVSLFPQLIAGPIIRYHEVALQLTQRTHTSQRMLSGIWRFCLGLAKKVLIANTMGEIADHAFSLDQGAPTSSFAWLGILCYTFQIYYDFSGYSDMAIGLGRMMGFEYPENFNAPYIARNFNEFWKRWHISLSNWMREYLYIPLGGNRGNQLRTTFNLWLVFLISGLWHGASWNFLLWGAYHGLFLSLHKVGSHYKQQRAPAFIAIPATFVLVMMGWVFFRAETLADSITYFRSLTGFTGAAELIQIPAFIDSYHFTVLLLAAFFSFIPLVTPANLHHRLEEMSNKPWHQTIIQFTCSLFLFVISACYLATAGFNPFIYFRF